MVWTKVGDFSSMPGLIGLYRLNSKSFNFPESAAQIMDGNISADV